MRRSHLTLAVLAAALAIPAAPALASLNVGIGTVLGKSGVHTGVGYRFGRWNDRLGAHVYWDASRVVNRRRDRERGERREKKAEVRENVLLRVAPERTWVYLNGARLDEDGRAELLLPPGRYRLEFVRPGYRTETAEIVVEPGVTYRIERRLSRLDRGEVPDPRFENPGTPISLEEALRR